jgi:hypothetical protein
VRVELLERAKSAAIATAQIAGKSSVLLTIQLMGMFRYTGAESGFMFESGRLLHTYT